MVDPIVDAQTRTIQLTAQVPNPDRRLKPGMSANVAVTLAERPDALVVPDEAVFAEGAQSFVYIVNPDSTVGRAAVSLGLRDSSRVEVTQGLTAGQRVVTAGHQKIFPGAHVVPIPAGMMAAGGPGGAAGGGPPGADAAAGAKPATNVAAGTKPGAGAAAGGKPAAGNKRGKR
jgi:membrane fusion protein (multidrug efflux system)